MKRVLIAALVLLLFSSHVYANCGVRAGNQVWGVMKCSFMAGCYDGHRVVMGYVLQEGTNVRVDWQNCYNCNEWADSCDLYLSSKDAYKAAKRQGDKNILGKLGSGPITQWVARFWQIRFKVTNEGGFDV